MTSTNWQQLLLRKGAINLLILLALVIALTLMTDHFLTWLNLRNVFRQVAVIAVVGAAFTLVMVAGGLDLSIGGAVALTGVIAAQLANGGTPLLLAFAVAIAAGAAIGTVNATLIVGLGLNTVIATLGTLYVCRGIANLMTDGLPVPATNPQFSTLGTGFLAGEVPYMVVLAAVVLTIFVILQSRTLLGRYTVAIGSNREAAKLSGIPVKGIAFAVFMLSGLAAGIGGVMTASQLSSGQPSAAIGFEFDVIVAAVLGGTSLLGGEGRVIGTALGALIIGVLNNGLNLLGVETFWQTVIQGFILVGAVLVDHLLGDSLRPRLATRAGTAATRSRPSEPSSTGVGA